MKNNSGLWNATFGEIGATLKALQDQGLTLEDLALLRSNKDLAKKVAETIKSVNGIKMMKKESDILRLLTVSEKLLLAKSDGRGIISQAKNVFKSYIDSDFENWGLNKKSKTTTETEIQVYEIAKDAIFKDMFTFLSDNLDSLCLTQDQIIDFCSNHSEYLRSGGYATFFLTKKDFKKPATSNNLFVIRVPVHSGGLAVYVSHFDDAYVWVAGCRHRLVVPKLS